MAPDIAIVGGGPSGLALAAILERSGFDYVVYERSARDTPPRGGCLDLHPESGQLAMREGGCFEAFQKVSRADDATVHWVWDHTGNKIFSWGHGKDAPEIDRTQIKECLLTAIPPERILWRNGVTETSRDQEGNVVLTLDDGTKSSGFKLVVGADGTWSKVRHLITPAVPQYAKVTYFTGYVHADNPFYPRCEEMAGLGPMVVMGRETNIWHQRQGDGHYRVELGILCPAEFPTNGSIDLENTDAVKKTMLQDKHFGQHSSEIKELISALEGPFRAWPLWHMPIESLNWSTVPGVAVIGDAAHTTTPFVGEGANIAMRDSVILAGKLKQFGITEQAVSEYEKEMFPTAIDVIDRSLQSGELFFDADSPRTFMEAMQKRPLIELRQYGRGLSRSLMLPFEGS